MKTLQKIGYYLQSVFRMIGGFRNWPQVFLLFLNRRAVNRHLVRLRQPPVSLAVRGAMDVWAVKETFLDAFYIRYGVPVRDGWTLVDIGAGVGDFSILAAYGHPAARVLAFEPFPESYEILVKNLLANALENVTPCQQAVWSHSGSLQLDISAGEPLQISSSEVVVEARAGQTVAVPAVTLADVLAEHDVAQVDLLKLDCEGAEYEILMSASAETLSPVQRIIMEYHDLSEAQNHSILAQYLIDMGYQVNFWPNVVHAEIGYLYASRPGVDS